MLYQLLTGRLPFGEQTLWGVGSAEWYLMLDDRPDGARRLFVKPDDRWEVNDVAQHHPELAAHCEEVLRGFVAATRDPGPLRAPELRDVEGEPTPESPEEKS